MINEKSKIKIFWEDFPENITQLTKHQLRIDFSQKYSVGVDQIEIVPRYIKIDREHKKESTLGDAIKQKIFDPKEQRRFYEDYLATIELNENFDKEEFFKLDALISSQIQTEQAPRNSFRVKRVWAKNLLSYKVFEKNFDSGIEVISSIPFNGSGKTNFINICKIAFFGEFKYGDTRTSLNHIFNEQTDEDEAFSVVLFEIDGTEYLVSRVFTKKKNSVSQSVNFMQICAEEAANCFYDSKNNELIDASHHNRMMDGHWGINLNKKSPRGTQDEISAKVGTLEDFYYSAILSRYNIDKWLQTKATERVSLFYGYFGLEALNDKGELAKKEYTAFKKKTQLDRISPESIDAENMALAAENKSHAVSLQILKQTIEKEEGKTKIINEEIKEISKKYYLLPDYLVGFDPTAQLAQIGANVDEIAAKEKETLEARSKISIRQPDKEKLILERGALQGEILALEPDGALLLEKTGIENQQYIKDPALEAEISVLKEQKQLLQTQYVEKNTEQKLLVSKLEGMEDETDCKKCGLKFSNMEEKEKIGAEIKSLLGEIEKVVEEGTLVKARIQEKEKAEAENAALHQKEKEIKTQSIKEKIERDLKSRKQAISDKMNLVQKEIDRATENERLQQQVLLLDSQIRALKSNNATIEQQLREYEASLSKIKENEKINAEISELENRREDYHRQIKELNTQKSEIANIIENNEKTIKKNTQTQEELKGDLLKDRMYQTYIRVHDRFDGIARFIIESYIPVMNECLRSVLAECTDFDVEIKFLDKKIEFFYKKGQEYREVYRTSGFQSDAASLAIHYTLMKLTTINVPNFLFVDEIFGSTAEGNLVFIHRILEKMLDIYDNIIIISHHPTIMQWANDYRYKVQVVTNSGYSELHADIPDFQKYYRELNSITVLSERREKEAEILQAIKSEQN